MGSIPAEGCPTKVRGIAFRTVLEQLSVLRGPSTEAQVRALLAPTLARSLDDGTLTREGWYPVADYCALWRAITDATGEGNDLVYSLGREALKADLSGFYRVAFHVLSPGMALSMGARAFREFYDTGSVSTVASRPGYGRVMWKDCKGFDANMWTEIRGAGAMLIELTGAKSVRIRLLGGGLNGDDWMEGEANWA